VSSGENNNRDMRVNINELSKEKDAGYLKKSNGNRAK